MKEESDHKILLEESIANSTFHPDIKDEVKVEVKRSATSHLPFKQLDTLQS